MVIQNVLRSLRTRLIAAALLGMLPALVVTLYLGFEHRDAMVEEAAEDARATVDALARNQRRILADTRLLLTALAVVPAIRRANAGACDEVLGEILPQHSSVANIGLIDSHRRLRCSARPAGADTSLEDDQWLPEIRHHDGYAIGVYRPDHGATAPTLTATYPVTLTDGTQAALIAIIKLTALAAAADGVELPAQAILLVTDRHGAPLVRRPSPAERLAARPNLALGARGGSPQGVITHVSDAEGGQWLHTAASVFVQPADDHPALHVHVAIPEDTLFASANAELLREMLILSLGTALAAALLLLTMEFAVIRGVRKLVRATLAVDRGELDARTGMRPKEGELGILGYLFDRMASSLERRHGESVRYQAQLIHLNRLYALLSDINGAIVRAQDTESLLDDACQIAVSRGIFAVAWAGLLDQDQRFSQTWFASHPEFHTGGQPGRGASLADHHAVGEALRSGEVVAVSFNELGPTSPAVLEMARRLGLEDCAAVPLRADGEAIGALVLCTNRAGDLEQQALALLNEMGEDLSFALGYLINTKRLEGLAFRDPLTGLPTNILLRDRLDQILAASESNQGERCALILIALDHLRQLSASHGRHATDQAIIEIARRIRAGNSGVDMVARIHTDEFALILPSLTAAEDVTIRVNDLLRTLSEPCLTGETKLYLTPRIAVTVGPDDGRDADTLLTKAGSLLALMRKEGQDSYRFFTSELQERAAYRMRLEQALRHALERGELSVCYQAIVNVRSGAPDGLEALVRWQSAQLGSIAPDQFIPIAEETGLIIALGEWVLNQVMVQLVTWERAGLSVPKISVNISAKQLHHPGFVDRVDSLMRRHRLHLQRHRLALEITETALIVNMPQVTQVVKDLRTLGLEIYLDDFGTGYSSLSYLKQLPVDRVKADLSFVRDIHRDPDSRLLVGAIVAMAHNLGLSVVAEGVASAAHLVELERLDCDYAQGNYIGRPAPADVIETWLRDHGRG